MIVRHSTNNLEFYLLVQTTDSCCTLLRTYYRIDTLLYLPSNKYSYHFKIVEMHIGKLPIHFLRDKSCYDIHISFNFDLLVLSMCSSKHLYVFVFFFFTGRKHKYYQLLLLALKILFSLNQEIWQPDNSSLIVLRSTAQVWQGIFVLHFNTLTVIQTNYGNLFSNNMVTNDRIDRI